MICYQLLHSPQPSPTNGHVQLLSTSTHETADYAIVSVAPSTGETSLTKSLMRIMLGFYWINLWLQKDQCKSIFYELLHQMVHPTLLRKHKINSIKKHYMDKGLANRVHKYLPLCPHNYNAYLWTSCRSYAEPHTVLLPDRIPLLVCGCQCVSVYVALSMCMSVYVRTCVYM